MLGLKITINGKLFANISPLTKDGVASAIISLTKRPKGDATQEIDAVLLQSGAIDNLDPSQKRISSWPNRPLSSGDKITIEVTTFETVTAPEYTEIENTDMVRKNKIAYLKQMEKELKPNQSE